MATVVWGGGSGPQTSNWDDATNWTGDTLPATGDDVVLDGTSNTNLLNAPSSPVTLSSFVITSGYLGNAQLSSDVSVTTTVDLQGGGGIGYSCNLTLVDVATININTQYDVNWGTGSSIKDCTVTSFSSDWIQSSGPILCKGTNSIDINGNQRPFNLQNTLENTLFESNGGGGTKNWSGGNNWIGQTFTLASPTDFSVIEISATTNIQSREQFRVEIYNTTAGLPTGVAIAQSDDFVLNEKLQGLTKIIFNSYVSLAAGTYAFILRPLSNFGIPVAVSYDPANGYAGGTFVQSTNGGSSWSAVAGEDLEFYIRDLSLTNVTCGGLVFGGTTPMTLNMEAIDFTVSGNVGSAGTNTETTPMTVVVHRNFVASSINLGEDNVSYPTLVYFSLSITCEHFSLSTPCSVNYTYNYEDTKTQLYLNAMYATLSSGTITDDRSFCNYQRIMIENDAIFQSPIAVSEAIYFDESVHKSATISTSPGSGIGVNSKDAFILQNQRVGGSF